MTTTAEHEPAPRRRATSPGDHRGVLDAMQWYGPDRRGILPYEIAG